MYYFSINKATIAEYKDRGSRFIAYAYPFADPEDLKKIIQGLKKEHAKAVHHCFAYRVGLGNKVFRVSDDGEPSGSAGKPILNAIDSKQLTNVLIVVVRYFGGTLLGVPGLINAYRSAASMALQLTPSIQYPVEIKYQLQFDYTMMNEVMMIVKQYNCTILKQENQLFNILEIGIPKAHLAEATSKLKELHTVETKKL
ncbi:IMPACT family protein [Parasediminibacterium sp. JCM 36343]|uniref:IMPACT family protein n=1 Tax=Parasediminibacterium sp. JCM 36343 TaxID=3374279 RepID=UPI00397AE11B